MISSDESIFTQSVSGNAPMIGIDDTTFKILVPTDPAMGELEDFDQCYVHIELRDNMINQTAVVQLEKDGYLFVNDCCVVFNGPEIDSITGSTVIQPRVYLNPVKYSGAYQGDVSMTLYDSNEVPFDIVLSLTAQTAIDNRTGREYQIVESMDIDQMASGEFAYPLVAVDGRCRVEDGLGKTLVDTFRIE